MERNYLQLFFVYVEDAFPFSHVLEAFDGVDPKRQVLAGVSHRRRGDPEFEGWRSF
jgi:hypothetical protein